MNVPNRYKGFSQLPENVQQRMDPSLANKYQMGGSVMQRPLFRQMGGPTDMMPQDMMPPPPMGGAPMGGAPMAPPPMDPAMEAQLMEAENMGAQTGEQIGAQFSQDMMMNLEGAEDYQSLIDGIRGNQLPIDARYQELAGYVGEQDAMATPESVLALTQPTIMMTEEGAMDSGIGELMQGIASDVPMQGPMDEGVGALMAAGAGNTPPVNFRNGGPVEVRGYSNGAAVSSGGGSRIMAQAERDVSDYEKYFSGGLDQEARAAALAEQNEMAKAQMLFDIAGTALNFAGNTQGNTIAERLASAASQTQLTDKIGARSAGILTAKQAQAAEERQLRMAARQASLGQAQTDEATRAAIAAASAKPRTPKMMNIVGADGKLIASLDAVNDAERYQQIIKANPTAKAYIPGTRQVANIKYVYTFDGNKYTSTPFNVNENLNGYNEALKVKNAFNEKGAEPRLAAIKKIAELNVTGRTQTWHRAKENFTLGNGTDARKVKKGEVIALTVLQANKLGGKIAEYDSNVSITEVYKFGEDSKLLISGTEFENQFNALGKGWSLTKPEFKQVVFSTVVNDKPVTETVDLSTPKGQRRAIELNAMNYEVNNPKVEAIIRAEVADRFAIKKEDREAKAPFNQLINDVLYRIDLTKPEGEQKTVILDGSTLPDVFGTGFEGKIMGLASNEALLAKYANNTLDKALDGVSVSEMETALVAYTSPSDVSYNSSTKQRTSTPGMPLNQAQIKALQARKAMGDLSLPTGVLFPADDIEQEALDLLKTSPERTDIPLADQLNVPSNVAFGSVAFLKNLANIGLEIIQLPTIFDETKNAADAIKSLNQEFETIYLAAQEIRDSVFQGKKLENLTPDPVKFLTGPNASQSKALILYKRLDREITRMENSIENPEVFLTETGAGSVGTKRERLPKLRDLRDGYALLAKINMAARGLDPEDIERTERQLQLIRDLNEASGIIED